MSAYVDEVLDRFIAEHDGKAVDLSGAYGTQSPDLIAQYVRDLTGLADWVFPYAYAKDLWPDERGYMERAGFVKVTDFQFERGDIAVYWPGNGVSDFGTLSILAGWNIAEHEILSFTQGPEAARLQNVSTMSLMGAWRLTAGAECVRAFDDYAKARGGVWKVEGATPEVKAFVEDQLTPEAVREIERDARSKAAQRLLYGDGAATTYEPVADWPHPVDWSPEMEQAYSEFLTSKLKPLMDAAGLPASKPCCGDQPCPTEPATHLPDGTNLDEIREPGIYRSPTVHPAFWHNGPTLTDLPAPKNERLAPAVTAEATRRDVTITSSYTPTEPPHWMKDLYVNGRTHNVFPPSIAYTPGQTVGITKADVDGWKGEYPIVSFDPGAGNVIVWDGAKTVDYGHVAIVSSRGHGKVRRMLERLGWAKSKGITVVRQSPTDQ